MKDDVEELQKASVEELLEFFNGPKAARESKVAKEGANLAVQRGKLWNK